MNIFRQLIWGSSFRVINMAVQVAVGLYLMPFIIHSLGDRMYGYWTLIATILGYYGLFDLGIMSAVQYFVAKSIGEKNERLAHQTINTAFFVFISLGVVISLITVIAAFLAREFIHDQSEVLLFRSVLAIMGVGFAITFPWRIFMGVLSAHLRFDLIASASMGTLLLRTALIVIFLSKGYGIVALAAVTVLFDLALNGFYYRMVKRLLVPFNISWGLVDYPLFKNIFSYSFYTLITKVGDRFRFYAPTFIIGGFLGVGAVTHYAIASKLGTYFLDFMVSSLGLLSPLFSILLGRKDQRSLGRALIFGTKISVAIATFTALCLILYGKPFILVWMGEAYLDAYIPLVILVIGIFCDVSQIPSVSYLYGIAKHRFLAYLTVIEGILNLSLSLWLVRYYGLIGVALGMTIPMVIIKLLVQPLYVTRKIGISLRHYFFRVFGGGMLVTGMGVILPRLVLSPVIIEPSRASIILLIFLHAVVALPAVYLLVLKKEEKDLVISATLGNWKAWKGIKRLVPE